MDNKAIKELKSDKRKAQSCNDIKELIKLCNSLGQKYRDNQRYSDAIDEHKQQLQYSLKIGCKLSEAGARRALGETYSENNQYTKALIEHKKYLSLAQSLEDQIEIQRAFATIGRTHLLHAEELEPTDEEYKRVLNESMRNNLKALKLCDELTEIKPKELAEMQSKLFINIGIIYNMMDKPSESITHFQLSITLNKQHQLLDDLYRSQFNLATVYEKENKDLKKCLNVYEETLKTANTLKDKTKRCDTLFGMGLLLMRLKKFEKSRKMFKKAFKLKSPIIEEQQKIERHLKIASIICDHFRQLSETNDLEKKIKLCDKLGDHFVELKLFDIAVDFYKQQLNYSIQTNKSDSEIAIIYVSIAQTYADDYKFNEAIEYFQHELNCNRGNSVEETKSLMKIAEMKEYLEREDLNQDIAQTYERAIEKISTLDNNLLADILQRYLTFVENRCPDSNKINEISERLKVANTQRKTSIEIADEDEDRTDIYEAYDLNDLSECSTDSDDEEVLSNARPKRMGKRLRTNQKGETPLQTACIEGNLKQVKKLLADKHPVNVRDNAGWTPLHEAALYGHLEIVDLLIKNGADINDNKGEKAEGRTPLHDACVNGNFDVIRLLLKSGAKVGIFNQFIDSPLDELNSLKKELLKALTIDEQDKTEQDRIEQETIEQEIIICNDIERQLSDCLVKEGFDPDTIKKIKSLKTVKKSNANIHKPTLRGNDSNDLPEIPINNLGNNLNSGSKQKDKSLDFDDPKVARKEYLSSISNVRRINDSKKLSEIGHNFKPIPSILNEKDCVDDDKWLIEDICDKRKRSCLDAFDAITKKPKTHYSNQFERTRKSIRKPARSRPESCEQSDYDESMSSENEIQSFEPIEDKCEENNEINYKNNKIKVNINCNKKPINMIVVFGDSDNTSLMIPIRDQSSNFLWLKEEAQKKYFENIGIKPTISLKTTDGALLSGDYCIFDVFDRQCVEHKVLAKIESWALDPLVNRYKEICYSSKAHVFEDIVNELEFTQKSGVFKLTDVNVPIEQIKPILRALHRQNNLREFDISFSNIVIDGSEEVFNCLDLLPSLQILNLKGTGLSNSNMEQLATKLCPNLVELNLSFNTFGDGFSEQIIETIRQFPKLNSIDLSACDLTNQFLQSTQFKNSIKNSNIRSVIFDYNSIDSILCEQFCKL